MSRYDDAPLSADWWKAALEPDAEQATTVIANVTSWDHDDYARLLREMNGLNAARRKLAGFAPTGQVLTEDAFQALFKASPDIAAVNAVRPDHLINRAVISELTGMVDYKELHGYTAGDAVAAAFATITLEPTLEELLDRERTRQQQADALQQKLAALMEALQAQADINRLGEQWRFEGEYPTQVDVDAADRLVDDLEAECAAMAAALADALEGDGPSIQATMQAAVAAAVDNAKGQGPNNTWGVERGHLVRMSAKERLALAKKINSPRMARIADLFGMLRAIMWAEQSKRTKTAEHWVADVELGNAIDRLLPSELLRMVDPDQEDMFLADFLTESLCQWRLEGDERVGQGRIIFCEDGSYSMRGHAGAVGGSRELWAKAVMLCLLHLARQQGREFSLIHFGSYRELWQSDFNVPDDWSAARIFDAAEIFFSGGTDFATPIRAAVAALREEQQRTGRVTGDIVFATDGHCALPADFIDWFRAEQEDLRFEMYGILIGDETKPLPLQTLTDGKLCKVDDLLAGGDIGKIFRSI